MGKEVPDRSSNSKWSSSQITMQLTEQNQNEVQVLTPIPGSLMQRREWWL